ncbi:hypothetical protein N7509_002000 [Penicillium cosmopolitanum]|uniref:PAS domain-containing protein n=1 Tax=Penicillium cosmopolitanum TaxID=1131564 RepID=A0A9X0BCW8_9EURO|nr:uncharacterized protein N7509_002000 [Penicillium cosmopolitanum]KAJ5408117.1 hypothetical protein N7509_002000 [Penicillium cosmopolitanum]
MDTTFITIHDLSRDASILYASDSIQVVLGYQPHEVLNRSCWDYFHPQELSFARSVHGRGVRLDKAAVLNYCSIRHRDGSWVGCECVFTVVYDVLIASTTVYGRGKGTQKRAVDAPIVRQLFDSSPNDPRYHMLTFISDKFSRRLIEPLHEPRAALFVNRFTRTATIMYATSGVQEILGLSPRQLVSKSFFYCIQEECLRDAVRCLEGAKANDSIAYLRFWFRNPLQEDNTEGETPDYDGYTSAGVTADSSGHAYHVAPPPVELEAVVSCTSDGLVVILRRARAPIPGGPLPPQPVPAYSNGLFAAPWALEPVLSYGPTSYTQPASSHGVTYPEDKKTLCRDDSMSSVASGSASASGSGSGSGSASATNSGSGSGSGYGSSDRQAAKFPRWSPCQSTYGYNSGRGGVCLGIVGINRSLEQYKYGTPSGDAHPEDAVMDGA